MAPLLSLVTGTLNRPGPFHRMLRSIEERSKVDWELIVSDASDPNQPYTNKVSNRVKIIKEWPRQGCVKGYNAAFRETQGKWVIYLNDDAEVMPGYDLESIAFMEEHSQIGLGALYYAELQLPYMINVYYEMIYANFGILSREFGTRIGWMDEVVKMYGNDNSLTFRTLMAGKGVGSIPNARIWHHAHNDQLRADNQANRSPDSRALMQKYLPFIPQMQATYQRFTHLVGPLRLEN